MLTAPPVSQIHGEPDLTHDNNDLSLFIVCYLKVIQRGTMHAVR
ncbi:hypothetical protein [Vibrio chagasii]